MDERRDAYEVLGVARTATSDEIRKAYRQAALKHHPDRNAGDASAAERFKEATESFQVLSDDQRRRVYDQFGWAGLEGGGGGFPGGGVDLGDLFGNFQDLFSEFFGGQQQRGGARSRGPRRGPDLRVLERLTLKEAAFGCKREIALQFPAPCEKCEGSGAAPGTSPVACATCRGSGQVSNARGFVMFTAPCPNCRGEGRVIKSPCPSCHGSGEQAKSKKIVVGFPAGIDEGQILRVSGQGVPSPNGGPAGDVLVQVEVVPDARFERHGVDLATKVRVSFLDAALGATVPVTALDEEPLTIDLPEGTQPGHVVVVRGRGVPRLDGKGRTRGALHVVVDVEIPTASALSPKARELLDALKSELAPPAKAAAAAPAAAPKEG
jgi:molecular chaperone DnaJ